ncbi:UNVERIFIED_CONTAM: hypothetical protein GTU68_059377 [Idotea baltica]|nr:hypothetical protein [Idotea baltica]
MYNDTGEIALVFNGEIYNYVELKIELEQLGHRFHSSSDTEVIIRAYEQWGLDCQSKFNGMWAIALWDGRKKQLLISRDRTGEKPLNYSVKDGTLLFGSEIKSILAYGLPAKPNMDLLELYLFLGFIPAPYTFYQDIHKLRAGHFLLVKDGDVNEHAYWDLPEVDENELRTDEKAIVEEFSELFADSIRIRMRSDVPYGAFLSGGLDSSSIVALMSEISNKPVETFTIGFAEKAFDERDKAKIIANQFNTNHHERVVEPSSFDESLRNVLYHYDEPFADPAAIPMSYVSDSARGHVKMVLTGDGGDEVFAGYSNYQSEKFASQYDILPGFVRKLLPKAVQSASSVFSGDIRYKLNRADRVLSGFNEDFIHRLTTKFVKIPPALVKELPLGKHLGIIDFLKQEFKGCPFQDPFYQLMYYNLKVSLPGQMLVKVDKMSMAHSLETRAPFLDHRIVELMYGVHKQVKMPTFQDASVKNVLKLSMKSKLPKSIIYRQKKGFDVPLREWFKDDQFSSKLDLSGLENWLNPHIVERLVAENRSGKNDNGTFIWRLILLDRWLKNM